MIAWVSPLLCGAAASYFKLVNGSPKCFMLPWLDCFWSMLGRAALRSILQGFMFLWVAPDTGICITWKLLTLPGCCSLSICGNTQTFLCKGLERTQMFLQTQRLEAAAVGNACKERLQQTRPSQCSRITSKNQASLFLHTCAFAYEHKETGTVVE